MRCFHENPLEENRSLKDPTYGEWDVENLEIYPVPAELRSKLLEI